MAAPDPTVVSLKLLIDPKSQRLLFAEAGKDFVDFLFSIMALPVGTVIRLLSKQGMGGCMGNIYDSIENLGDSYMQSAANRDILLKPQAFVYGVYEPRLLPSLSPSTYTDFMFVHLPNKGRGFVKEAATYMITDDLVVRPMSTNSIISLLNQFSVKDVGDLEEKDIAVGVNEGVKLLRASMQYKEVLTAVFLGIKSEPS